MNWVLAGVGVAFLAACAYVVYLRRALKASRTYGVVQKAISDHRGRMMTALQQEMATRHAATRAEDVKDAETARTSDAAAAEFLSGSGGTRRGADGPVPDTGASAKP